MKTNDIEKIQYVCSGHNRKNKINKSIKIIGLDTEAYPDGKCFLICTSLGDSFTNVSIPDMFFSRKYRGKNFVVYNLKYDSGALLQHLKKPELKELQTTDNVKVAGYSYRTLGNKCLVIRKGKNSVHIFDMLNFYNSSLNAAAKKYLGEEKIDLDPTLFSKEFVKDNIKQIEEYCIQDSILVAKLAEILIKRFEKMGVYPKKLYSVAYIAYQYFSTKCINIVVKKFWDSDKELLGFALRSYNGGKFEVTKKGQGHFFEYDISSAYPSVMRDLVDIRHGRAIHSKKYRKNAVYGFLLCDIIIPYKVYSPVAIKKGFVNCYAVGEIKKVITKIEYEYLISQGCDITIRDAWYIFVDVLRFPYRTEIEKLYRLKNEYKQSKSELDYHTVKILLNSFYGKMLQLIKKDEGYKASACWNPVYGSHITASVRTRISGMQQKYNNVIAVHTDSVITDSPIQIKIGDNIGDWNFELEGDGIILGSGVYQIGSKVKFRGLHKNITILNLLKDCKKHLEINYKHAYTWREIAHRGWDIENINLFDIIPKKINVRFDQKRVWLDDWQDWTKVLERNVRSTPIYRSLLSL